MDWKFIFANKIVLKPPKPVNHAKRMADCSRKKCFADLNEAEAAARVNRQFFYLCPYCDYWHLSKKRHFGAKGL